MLKLPKGLIISRFHDFNILEFYHSVLEGKISLKNQKVYLIVRKDEKWIDHNDWAKKGFGLQTKKVLIFMEVKH